MGISCMIMLQIGSNREELSCYLVLQNTLFYLAIIPRVHVGYEMVDGQRGT